MTFGRPVTCLANLTAASVISAPELAKKNVSMRPGTSSASRVGQRLEQIVGEHVGLEVDATGRLPGDRLDHVGMAVTGRVDSDAGREVEVLDAVDGRHPTALPTRDLQVRDLEPHVGQVRHGAETTPDCVDRVRLAGKLLDSPPELAAAAPQRRSPTCPICTAERKGSAFPLESYAAGRPNHCSRSGNR